ncbi:hypothetical protein VKT23_004499 [Stygiomarasmius scandens]|uniref:Uncharacterized protein n=1 Tax=Marasmiellus scandens TaxID=2682957 RepID=A0ABR1JV33_9AGAR
MENDLQRYMDSLSGPDRAEFAALLTCIAGLTPARHQDRTNVQAEGQPVEASTARGSAGPGQANITPSPAQAGATTRDQRRGVMAFLHVICSDGDDLAVLEETSASSADEVYSVSRRQHTTHDGPLNRDPRNAPTDA